MVFMDVSAIKANGLNLPAIGLRQIFDQLAKTPNPVDAVSLSDEAVTASQHHIAFSLDIKAQNIREEIASLAINIIG